MTRRSGAIKHLPGARCLQIIAAAAAETVQGENPQIETLQLSLQPAAMPSHPAGAALLALALCVLLEDGEPRGFEGPGCSRGLGVGGTAGQFLPGCAGLHLCALESQQHSPEV